MQTEPKVQFRKAKVRVPVRANGQLDWEPKTRSAVAQQTYLAYQRGLNFAHRKPERNLGAPWIDDLVGTRQVVNLCEECRRRYTDWWKQYNYATDWRAKIGECDGCEKSFHFIVGFYPDGRSPFNF